MRIQTLPTHIANQIAAGEVIERPASVVKELLENAQDAKATRINIDIEDSGFRQIRVSDDGMGICSDDLFLAIAPHATSKIREVNDLNDIRTLGFRGEALASIAAISQLTLHSRPADQAHGMALRFIEGEPHIVPCPRNQGTTIEVRDIFYNVPVRKKFLKSARFEFLAIDRIVRCFALGAPAIHLVFTHNGRKVLQLPSATSKESQLARVQRLLGKNFVEDASYLDQRYDQIQLSGWISRGEHQRSQNDRQWLYVNGRMVKDKLLNHAIKQSYQDFLDPGRYPICVLYLNVRPDQVDVNVHPTKYEVRFQEPRTIHNFIQTTLTAILEGSQREGNMPSSLNDSSPIMLSRGSVSTAQKILATDSFICAEKSFTAETSGMQREVEGMSVSTQSSEQAPFNRYRVDPLEKNTVTLMIKDVYKPAQGSDALSFWLNLNQKFALVAFNAEYYLINVCQLRRHWLRNTLNKASIPLASRMLSVPVRYVFETSSEVNYFNDYQRLFEKIGIQLTLIGEKMAVVRSLPQLLPNLDLQAFFKDVLRTVVDTLQGGMSQALQKDQQAKSTLEATIIPFLLEKLVQHETVNVHYLSVEEKQTLRTYLVLEGGLSPGHLASWVKHVSLQNCEKWLNV